jgi:hypothetical protein
LLRPKNQRAADASTATPSINNIMDNSIERAMYDEVLGPLVSRGAVSYHNYLASKPSTQAALNENIEYSNIINPKEISKEKKIYPKYQVQ